MIHPILRAVATATLLMPALANAQVVEPPAIAPALSLEEAISIARERNPDLLQQRNDMDVARWGVRSAYADFLPSASASSSLGYQAAGERRFQSVGFGEQPDYYSSNYSVGLSLDLSGAKLLQPSVAKSQARATARRIDGAEAVLVSQVTQQYLTVLQAREALEQALREVARTEEYVRLAQAQLDVGAGTALDVRRAEVQRGQAQIRVVQARNTVATSTLQLGQLLGAPLEPETRLTSEFVLFEPRLDTELLVTAAVRNNPNLLAARAAVNAARTSVKAARTSYLPVLSFSAGLSGSVYQAGNINPLVDQQIAGLGNSYNQCLGQNEIRTRVELAPFPCASFNPNDPAVIAGLRREVEAQNSGFPFNYIRQPFTAAVAVSLPIFTGLDRQLQVERAKADASDFRQQVRARELQLRADVATAVRNVETAYETAILQEQVVRSAAEELRLAQERFRYGLANSIEVSDAQTNLSEAERAQIEAVYNFHQFLAALEALIGEPLADSSTNGVQ